MGDFNSKHIKFGSSVTDKSGIKLQKIIKKKKLIITNNGEPTYYNEFHNNCELLDLIIISQPLKSLQGGHSNLKLNFHDYSMTFP